MGPYAKTMILLLLLVYLTFPGIVKGLEHGATASAKSATKEDMIQVKMRKLRFEVDTLRDYNPIPNPKHEPGPPRGKSGASAGGGGGGS